MNAVYTKLIEREKAASPGAEIVYDVIYWPIIVASPNHAVLDHDLEQLLLYVEAGYEDIGSLRLRLRRRGGQIDHQIEHLIYGGYLKGEIDGDGRTCLRVSLDKAARATIAATQRITTEAVTGNAITLPHNSTLLTGSQVDPTIPIMSTGGLDSEQDGLNFIECLAMLIFSGITRARAVRIFHGRDEMLPLQEILYDLVLDGSEHLSRTKFAAAVAKQAGEQPIVTSGESDTSEIAPSLPHRSNVASIITVQLPNLQRDSPKVDLDQRRSPAGRSNAEQSPVQIIAGRKAHEQMLVAAMMEAKRQIVIVTPFIRRRLTDFTFKQRLREALQRGVNVIVLHGMPTNDDQFDDTQFEIERIDSLLGAMGSHAPRLKFVRVTDNSNSASGEHSKILVCDERWAVVTSFNWLSFQETNETGVRFDHQDSVIEILRLFDGYILDALGSQQTRSEVKAPWPYSNREMSEWIYGEYNSQ